MAKFLFTPTIYSEKVITARIGGNAAGTRANDYDTGKFVKLGGDSNYVLVSSADAIEGVVTSVETGVYDGYSLGGVVSKGFVEATANGLQATAGTGTLAVGDYVLATAPAAIQTNDTAPAQGCQGYRPGCRQGRPVQGPCRLSWDCWHWCCRYYRCH
jgi:hypothetical protein